MDSARPRTDRQLGTRDSPPTHSGTAGDTGPSRQCEANDGVMSAADTDERGGRHACTATRAGLADERQQIISGVEILRENSDTESRTWRNGP